MSKECFTRYKGLLGVWVKLSAGCQLPERVLDGVVAQNCPSEPSTRLREEYAFGGEAASWQGMAKGEANKIKVESEGCSSFTLPGLRLTLSHLSRGGD